MKQLIIAISAFLLAIACKKEKDEIIPPAGYWKGAFSGGQTICLLQRENKTGRMYWFQDPLKLDTATDAVKIDGTWQLDGYRYEGIFKRNDSIVVTVTLTAVMTEPYASLTGPVRIVTASGAGTASYVFIKE